MPEEETKIEEVTSSYTAHQPVQSPFSLGTLGEFLKTWVPIVVMIISGIIGYVVFKTETAHQISVLSTEIQGVKDSIQNYQDLNDKIEIIERSNLQRNMYIKFLVSDARSRGVNIPEIDL